MLRVSRFINQLSQNLNLQSKLRSTTLTQNGQQFTYQCKFSLSEQPNNKNYQEKFEKLKEQVGTNKSDKEIKMNYYENLLKSWGQKINEKVKSSPEQSSQQKQQQSQQQSQQQQQQQTQGQEQQQQQSQQSGESPAKRSYFSSLKETKIGEIVYDAWQQTFPDEKYNAQKKREQNILKAKQQAEMLKQQQSFTEEELEKIQGEIPEWKKNQLQTVGSEGTQQKETLKDKLIGSLKEKVVQSTYGKQILESEHYKEYSEFKKDLKQLKEDAKDYVNNSPSNIVQGSLFIYSKATNESTTAKATRMQRAVDPDFNLFELESEAGFIFNEAYKLYLNHDLAGLEKICGEQALGYFKTLIKAKEAAMAEPKFKDFWHIDRAVFTKAVIPDQHLPAFVFTIRAQYIHCFIHKIDAKKIVDGADDRIISADFMFALRHHQSPDIENFGHGWEIVEVQEQQVVQMLA